MSKPMTKNMAALEIHDPSAAARVGSSEAPPGATIVPSRGGPPTLTVNGISLHSRFDPLKEADRLARGWRDQLKDTGKTPAVFGFGLGYHILALAWWVDRMIVIEPEPGIVRLAFEHVDFTEVIPKIQWAANDPGTMDRSAALLLPHPPSRRLYQRIFDEWTNQPWGMPLPLGLETADMGSGPIEEIPGLASIEDEYPPGAGPNLDDLAAGAKSRRGPLSTADVYILLLHSLARAGGE